MSDDILLDKIKQLEERIKILNNKPKSNIGVLIKNIKSILCFDLYIVMVVLLCGAGLIYMAVNTKDTNNLYIDISGYDVCLAQEVKWGKDHIIECSPKGVDNIIEMRNKLNKYKKELVENER